MKTPFTGIQLLTEIKNYFFILLGLFIFAFAWSAFLIPHKLTGGGISGIAAILYFATEVIPIGVTVFVGNMILVLISLKILGKKFAIKTIVCSVMLSLAFSIMKPLFPEPLVDDMFLCSLIGAMLSGLGVGMALNNGGNTGGTDIIALMIGKYRNILWKGNPLCEYYNSVFFLFYCGSMKTLYSFVVMIAYVFASDLVLDGFRQTYQIMLFSEKNNEIADQINKELNRGATFIKGYGAYSKKESDILLVIAHKPDKRIIIKIIKNVDKSAFISIAKANSVYGKNFDEIKL
jgi:uncharacterized membrane-anchored protein YitT (DUF2179 family)